MTLLVRCSCGMIDVIGNNRQEYKHENLTVCVQSCIHRLPNAPHEYFTFSDGIHDIRFTLE